MAKCNNDGALQDLVAQQGIELYCTPTVS